ncbi:neuropeptide-like protein C4orf48 homolog isoform X2 [Osmerus mordax]|uniref:neuropeptide-like protein C4orf48 homolog isoform X2 n=1 Tax=Osmerus mordax TaxID=8014 RepID=UPI00350F3413
MRLTASDTGFSRGVHPTSFCSPLNIVRLASNAEETGTVIPAESRPCVDCHAFEFMQRALQDLKKTAFNLDARTETLVLRAERKALCDCMPTNSLR